MNFDIRFVWGPRENKAHYDPYGTTYTRTVAAHLRPIGKPRFAAVFPSAATAPHVVAFDHMESYGGESKATIVVPDPTEDGIRRMTHPRTVEYRVRRHPDDKYDWTVAEKYLRRKIEADLRSPRPPPRPRPARTTGWATVAVGCDPDRMVVLECRKCGRIVPLDCDEDNGPSLRRLGRCPNDECAQPFPNWK